MNEKIHFYAPSIQDHISPVLLWLVVHITANDDGDKWLETQWTGGGDFQGIVLYTSVPDAIIAAKALNKSDTHSQWKVYLLSDLNITEMMISMKARKKKFSVMLISGFSIDDFRNLVLHSNLCRSLQFPEVFTIGEGLDPVSNKVILKFDESLFAGMNDYWHEEFENYCESMKALSAQPPGFIKGHARNAVSDAFVTKTPVISAASQYCVSTYSIEKQVWVVSSLDINGAKPANNLH